jgi:hypothetical protein
VYKHCQKITEAKESIEYAINLSESIIIDGGTSEVKECG